MMTQNNNLATQLQPLMQAITQRITQARSQVRQAVNSAMVVTYGEIGRLIVEHEQQGESRAAYGKQQLQQISRQLTERLLASKDKALVESEAHANTRQLAETAKDYLRAPYILDFLNLQDKTYQENDIEQGIIANLSDINTEIQPIEQRLRKTSQIKQGMMQELLPGRRRLDCGKSIVNQNIMDNN